MKKLIAVAGSIGSGKSSLINFLCQSYPVLPIHDVANENPYLADFFSDMQKWSFHSQIFFLARKFARFRKISNSLATVIISRTIHEDAEIFARNLYQSGLMSETDFRTYYEFYLSLVDILPKPDLLIYLHSPVNVTRRRLSQRQEAFYNIITDNYLHRLNRLYVNWIADYDQSEVLIIDTKQLDFVNNLVDRADLLESIERYI
jgi:deoxyadenosine/deoxycytidine kinase